MSKNIVSQNVVVIPESVKEQLKKEVLEAFPGVVVTVNNLNIWVSGDTKPIKDELKAFGFKWASKRKAWFMRVPDTAKPYDGYQEEPEEQTEESEQMKQIRAMLEQYKAGEISFDEYMTKQKEICAECSARCAVKVAGATSPALEKDGSYSLEPCYKGFPLEKIVLKITREGDNGAYYAESHYLVNTTGTGYHHKVDHRLLPTWDIDMDHIAGYLPAPKEEAEPELELPGMPETEDERLQRVYSECVNIMHDAGLETCGQIISVKINRRLSRSWGRCKTNLKSLNHEIEVRKTLFECDSDTPLKSTILHELCHTVNLCWHGHDVNFRNAARKIEAITGLSIARATCIYAELEASHA